MYMHFAFTHTEIVADVTVCVNQANYQLQTSHLRATLILFMHSFLRSTARVRQLVLIHVGLYILNNVSCILTINPNLYLIQIRN